jgi:hypothetical protein
VLLSVKDEQASSRAKDQMTKELIERFGGYDAFGTDDRLVDSKVKVRNLKTNVVEIRPKIFTDKPTDKQLDMTFETKMQVMNSSAFKKIQEVNGLGGAQQMKSMSLMPTQKLLKVGEDDDPLMKTTPTEAKQKYKQEGDFLYGHVSATQLEEFVVIKFNKKNKP